MAQGTSFSTQGALPKGLGTSTSLNFGNLSTSPKSSALDALRNGTSGGQNQSQKPLTPIQGLGGVFGQNASNFAQAQQPVHESLKAPTNQPIKNQTVKSADGTVTTQTYHVPEATTPTAPEKPSAFGSAVGGLLDTQKTAQNVASPFQGMLAGKATTATPEVSQATTGLLNRQQELSPEVQKANLEYSQFAKANPMMSSDVRNNPNVASEVSVGRGRALGETLAGQQHALADTVTNALAGQGQQITAGTNAGTLANTQSQQQITAANNAAANALEGQSQGITAGQQAGTLAQPQAYGLEQQPFNPVTGQFEGGGAEGALGRARLAGDIQATKATASNQGQQVQQWTSAVQQGQALQGQLNDLIISFGLNPNVINAVNTGLQLIAKNTSSPQYKMLENLINEVANTYAQVMTPTGGSQTDTSRSISQSMLDATASGQSILAVMKQVDEAAKAKIANVMTQNSGANAGGGTGTGGLYDF